MMKFLRSQSQTVLALVLAFIAFGFLFYGNAGNLVTFGSSHTNNDFGRIDGDDLTVGDLYDSVREARYSILLSNGPEVLQQQGMAAQIAETAWAQKLLLHEADRLHINVTPQEIADWIRNQKTFETDAGAFDLDKYNAQMKDWQVLFHVTGDSGTDPQAATRTLFENLVRDSLRVQAVRSALFGTVRMSAQDVTAEYAKRYAPTTVSYVVFDPKTFESKLHITPADIEAEYKNNPTNPAYRTAEKRRVDYVFYTLSPDQMKLPDDQKQAAKDALGQKALELALAFQPNPSAEPGTAAPNPDFAAEVRKRGLTPATTDFFAEDQPPGGGLPPSPAFNHAAFSLSSDNAVSKVVEMDSGVAVLHLVEIQPSDLRPLDQVQADIEKNLLEKKAQQSVQVNAQITGQLVKATMARGISFAAAASNLHQQVVTLPAFVPQSVQDDPKLGPLAYQAVQLKDNEISQPFALPGDGQIAVLHIDSRGQADPAGLADFEKRFRAQADQRLQSLVTNDWVNWKDKQTGTHKPPDLDAYGTVE